jgi:hypothetical protein
MIDTMSVDELRAARTKVAPVAEAPVDHPGRWLGGAIGAVTSLGAALVGMVVLDREQRGVTFDPVEIALLGIPIAWILGRALFPMARAGWRSALGAAVLVAVAAPPLGAIEILSGAVFQTNATVGIGSTTPGLAALILLPIAIPFSYLALVVTAPVGLVWAVLVRMTPATIPARLRAPRLLERLGTRHIVTFAAAILVVVQVVQAVQLAPR